jgi:hypothetical protein
MTVIVIPEVRLYLQELAHLLYINHYFGYKESAHKYVDDLLVDIEFELPYIQHKEAPPYFDRYGQGMFYATFRKNRQTHWHIFFDKYSIDGDIVYVVRFIGNNHTIAQYL